MSIYSNRRYVIIDVSELHKVNFNEIHETSIETVRLSLDKSKTFIKYDLPTPTFLEQLNTKSQEYTYDEFLTILGNGDWTQNII